MMDPFSFAGSSPSEPEEILVERSDFQIRCADTRGQRSKSGALIERMYAWRGYKRNAGGDASDKAINQVTLQASRGDRVFGTLTVGFDSEIGLAADELYRVEIDAYRNAGARVCELTRLAIEREQGSRDVLGALFHLAHVYMIVHRASDIFIEVNPRHVGFYKRMLQFTEAGEAKMCPRVEAPAVLLHLSVKHVVKQVERYGGHREEARGLLYPHFFAEKEVEGLSRRILAGDALQAYESARLARP